MACFIDYKRKCGQIKNCNYPWKCRISFKLNFSYTHLFCYGWVNVEQTMVNRNWLIPLPILTPAMRYLILIDSPSTSSWDCLQMTSIKELEFSDPNQSIVNDYSLKIADTLPPEQPRVLLTICRYKQGWFLGHSWVHYPRLYSGEVYHRIPHLLYDILEEGSWGTLGYNPV